MGRDKSWLRYCSKSGKKNMSVYYKILLFGFLVSLISGCGPKVGSPEAQLLIQKKMVEKKAETVETTTDKIPGWCDKLPASNLARYACGIGSSANLNIARSRAMMQAKKDIADQVQGEVSSLTEVFTKSIGTQFNEQIQETTESVVRNVVGLTSLAGYRVAKSKTIDKEGRFLHYVLLEYPIGEANNALLAEIRKNEFLTTQESSDKAMAKLEAEIERRRNR